MGIRQVNLEATVVDTTPAPVHVVVATAVLYLIAVHNEGVSSAVGVAAIDQGTSFLQLIVD